MKIIEDDEAQSPAPPLPEFLRDSFSPDRGDRPGVAVGQGGLARQGDATFLPSNVLSQRALAPFPPSVQSSFSSRRIDRPSDTSDVYDQPKGTTSVGGGYYPGDGHIALGRGIEDVEGQTSAVNAARHELLHAMSRELQPFANDEQQDYPQLKAALEADFIPLMTSPQTKQLASKVIEQIRAGDWGHVFTELGLAHVNGVPLPPNLKSHFGQLNGARPLGIDPRRQDPDADTPPKRYDWQNSAREVGSQMESVLRNRDAYP